MKKEKMIIASVLSLIQETPFLVGDRLPAERTLAERFGTSRHTLRSALRSLEAGGVLAIRAGSGCYVLSAERSPAHEREKRPEDRAGTLDAHIEARLALEPAIGAVAAEKATEEDIGELENGLMQISRALMTGGIERIAEEHRLFHNRMVACTRNPCLEDIGRQLGRDRRSICRRLACYDQSAQEDVFSACVAVVNAIKQGDADKTRSRVQALVRQDGRLMSIGRGALSTAIRRATDNTPQAAQEEAR